jgi:hypothetical protein
MKKWTCKRKEPAPFGVACSRGGGAGGGAGDKLCESQGSDVFVDYAVVIWSVVALLSCLDLSCHAVSVVAASLESWELDPTGSTAYTRFRLLSSRGPGQGQPAAKPNQNQTERVELPRTSPRASLQLVACKGCRQDRSQHRGAEAEKAHGRWGLATTGLTRGGGRQLENSVSPSRAPLARNQASPKQALAGHCYRHIDEVHLTLTLDSGH